MWQIVANRKVKEVANEQPGGLEIAKVTRERMQELLLADLKLFVAIKMG